MTSAGFPSLPIIRYLLNDLHSSNLNLPASHKMPFRDFIKFYTKTRPDASPREVYHSVYPWGPHSGTECSFPEEVVSQHLVPKVTSDRTWNIRCLANDTVNYGVHTDSLVVNVNVCSAFPWYTALQQRLALIIAVEHESQLSSPRGSAIQARVAPYSR